MLELTRQCAVRAGNSHPEAHVPWAQQLSVPIAGSVRSRPIRRNRFREARYGQREESCGKTEVPHLFYACSVSEITTVVCQALQLLDAIRKRKYRIYVDRDV